MSHIEKVLILSEKDRDLLLLDLVTAVITWSTPGFLPAPGWTNPPVARQTVPPVIEPRQANQVLLKLVETMKGHAAKCRAWIEIAWFEKDWLKDGENAGKSLQNAFEELRSTLANKEINDIENLTTKLPPEDGPSAWSPSAKNVWKMVGGWFCLLWVIGFSGFGAFASATLKFLGETLGEILRERLGLDYWIEHGKEHRAEQLEQRAHLPGASGSPATPPEANSELRPGSDSPTSDESSQKPERRDEPKCSNDPGSIDIVGQRISEPSSSMGPSSVNEKRT